MPSAVPDYCLLYVQSLCMPRSDWAAWVQAVGSVLAIGVSVWLVQRTHALQLRAALIARHQLRRAILESWMQLFAGAAEKVDACLEVARGRTGGWTWFDKLQAELGEMGNAAGQLDISTLETYAELEPVIAGRAIMAALRAHAGNAQRAQAMEPQTDWAAELSSAVRGMEVDLRRRAGQLRALVDRIPV